MTSKGGNYLSQKTSTADAYESFLQTYAKTESWLQGLLSDFTKFKFSPKPYFQ